MDMETIKVWLQGINMIGTFALGVWLYLEKRSDKTNQRVTDLDKKFNGIKEKVIAVEATCGNCPGEMLAAKVDQLDKGVSKLEATNESAPNHNDIARVYDSINELSEKVNQLVGENRGQSDTLRMIQNHIMHKGLG